MHDFEVCVLYSDAGEVRCIEIIEDGDRGEYTVEQIQYMVAALTNALASIDAPIRRDE